MSVHILCPECEEDIGEIFTAYEKVKEAFFQKTMISSDIDLDKITLKEDILPSVSFILKAFHIKNHCCIVHIIGATEYDI